jgi:hypothetical protein
MVSEMVYETRYIGDLKSKEIDLLIELIEPNGRIGDSEIYHVEHDQLVESWKQMVDESGVAETPKSIMLKSIIEMLEEARGSGFELDLII